MVTAEPGPTLAELEGRWAAEAADRAAQEAAAAEGDEEAGIRAMLAPGGPGPVPGVDPADIGKALRIGPWGRRR